MVKIQRFVKGYGKMRVIAGTARRTQLKTPEGMDTRPTTDRIKETLFNMLQPYICECSFLDLFSGSGAIGIEALSRGAEWAVFLEQKDEPVCCIKENLKKTKLEDKAELVKSDVIVGLKQLEARNEYFDIVFMDPPYNCNLEKKVLEYLSHSSLVDKDTTIVFEASMDTDISYIEACGYKVHKIKKYKTNMHVFVYPEER